jgi:hypothetical protein
MSAADAAAIRERLKAYEAEHGILKGKIRQKSQLLFTWLVASQGNGSWR